MRFREFVTEKDADTPAVEELKAQLLAKIKELPTDPATMKTLQEIEDLLAAVGAGSRSEMIGNVLKTIEDPDVNKAQKLLAKYVLSLDASPEDRKKMLDVWKNDKLVNVSELLKPGQRTVQSLINGYDQNPAIKELTDDLSQIAALGQGKGEFLLSVFSKKITKAGKGDLAVDGVGTLEVKTTDQGAGRFFDQQVRPTSKYQGAANDFKDLFKDEIAQQKVQSATGISVPGLIRLYGSLPTDKRSQFQKAIKSVITQLFPSAPNMVDPIVNSIMAGNANQAKQRYAVANLNNYMAQKDDVGILVINLKKDPYSFVFFKDNRSLNQGGLRLHSSTAYPITDEFRNAYPQTDVKTTAQKQEEI
jgi:hypothetical protein